MKKSVDTSSIEYYASFLGAILISLGLGALLQVYLSGYAVWMTLAGLIMHSYGMYKIYKG